MYAFAAQYWNAFSAAFQGVQNPPIEYLRNHSTMELEPNQGRALAELMRPVKTNGHAGTYLGADMNLIRTRLAAGMSGDWNDVHVNSEKPHPLFGKLIAHGMDAVTQAVAALRLDIGEKPLVPVKADITFRQPVFLEEDRLEIRIAPPEDVLDMNREVSVYASGESVPERLVVKMAIVLEEDRILDEHSWFRAIMSAWRISALLAETWPGCLYLRQQLNFGRPASGNSLGAYVRGEGKDARGNCRVYTQAHSTSHTPLPAVSGMATIMLPAHAQ